MPAKRSTSPQIERIRAELRALADEGLWDVEVDKIQQLRRLSVFGGSDEAPASLTSFRPALRDFLKTKEELEGALSEMAVRLFGAETPYRDLGKTGREGAAGDVEWRGQSRVYDTVRRAGGLRDQLLDRIADAVALAETEALESRSVDHTDPEVARGSLTDESTQSQDQEAPALKNERFLDEASSTSPGPTLADSEQTDTRRRTPRLNSKRARAASFFGATLVVGVAAYLLAAPSLFPVSIAHRTGGYIPSNRAAFSCARKENCLGPGYPVFDSYTDAPNYGDERDFFNVKPISAGAISHFQNYVAVTRGDEELLRVYYDNDGDPRAEPRRGASTAYNTRVSVSLPFARAKTLDVAANITASNTQPRVIGDTVTFYGARPFNIVYVPHTARLWNQAHRTGLPLPNELVSGGGTLIGYRKMDGNITGCFCQSGLITLRVLIE
jgi:hypothetical protein